jgi:hypothetical protein
MTTDGPPTLADQVSRLYDLTAGYHATTAADRRAGAGRPLRWSRQGLAARPGQGVDGLSGWASRTRLAISARGSWRSMAARRMRV